MSTRVSKAGDETDGADPDEDCDEGEEEGGGSEAEETADVGGEIELARWSS